MQLRKVTRENLTTSTTDILRTWKWCENAYHIILYEIFLNEDVVVAISLDIL